MNTLQEKKTGCAPEAKTLIMYINPLMHNVPK